MILLVSELHAVRHIRPAEADDPELLTKLFLASAIVMNYIKLTDVPDEWLVTDSPLPSLDEEDISIINSDDSPSVPLYRVPGNVQSATLLVLGELYENREASTSNPISAAAVALLTPFRDPTMA